MDAFSWDIYLSKFKSKFQTKLKEGNENIESFEYINKGKNNNNLKKLKDFILFLKLVLLYSRKFNYIYIFLVYIYFLSI